MTVMSLPKGPEADGLSGPADLRHLLAEGGLVLLLFLIEGDPLSAGVPAVRVRGPGDRRQYGMRSPKAGGTGGIVTVGDWRTGWLR